MSEDKKETPSSQMMWGIFMILGAAFIYYYLNQKEQTGESFKINIIFYFIYEALGKLGVSGVILFIGLATLISGINNRKKQQKLDAIELENSRPTYISVNEEQFLITRKPTESEINYLDDLKLDVKHGEVYKHFWIDDVNRDEKDLQWLNMGKYFWKADVEYFNTGLEEVFRNYQQLNFRFLEDSSSIKSEKITSVVEKYHYEKDNQVVFIPELLEQNLIEYCQIINLDEDNIFDMKYFSEDLFLLITNPKIKYKNNDFYIGTEKITLQSGYAIGGIEMIKRIKNHVLTLT
jgi:hypothetical protein